MRRGTICSAYHFRTSASWTIGVILRVQCRQDCSSSTETDTWQMCKVKLTALRAIFIRLYALSGSDLIIKKRKKVDEASRDSQRSSHSTVYERVTFWWHQGPYFRLFHLSGRVYEAWASYPYSELCFPFWDPDVNKGSLTAKMKTQEPAFTPKLVNIFSNASTDTKLNLYMLLFSFRISRETGYFCKIWCSVKD